MIPKVIHYIWIGGNPLPKIAEKCIDSWKKFCPDFEIKCWDESNLNIDYNLYTRQAYNNKKWAFVSDVLRYDILVREGGIYMDIDVELLKPIDELLNCECFTGFESKKNIAPGLIMGAEKNSYDIKELLKMYDGEVFIKDDGSMNLRTICDRANEYYYGRGLKEVNEIQVVSHTTIYPKEYFNPTNLDTQKINITEKTYSIHHYNASWYTGSMKIKRTIKTILNFISFGLFGKIYAKIAKR